MNYVYQQQQSKICIKLAIAVLRFENENKSVFMELIELTIEGTEIDAAMAS